MATDHGFGSRTIHFKHVYGTGVDSWGVVAFPSTQPADSACRRYSLGDPVLLAIPQNPERVPHATGVPEELHGKIFAVCTLVKISNSATREIANPERIRTHPEVADRWPTALPVLEYWSFDEPYVYASFGSRELAELASKRRGHLFQIPVSIEADVRRWLERAPRTAKPITHSDRVRSYLERLTRS